MSYSASMGEMQQRPLRRQRRQGIVFRAQTYRNILYLFASLTLGLF